MSEDLARGVVRAQVPVRFLDLSLGGGLLVLAAPLKVGAIHDFALDILGDRIWVQCEVRHCRAAGRGAGYQVGVQFIGVDPRDEKILREYLENRR